MDLKKMFFFVGTVLKSWASRCTRHGKQKAKKKKLPKPTCFTTLISHSRHIYIDPWKETSEFVSSFMEARIVAGTFAMGMLLY